MYIFVKLSPENLNLAHIPNTLQTFILVEYAVVNTNLNLDKHHTNFFGGGCLMKMSAN